MSDNTVNTNLYQASSDTQTTSGNQQSPSTQVAGTPFHDNRPSLHIALVTETWLPDINGVASSVYQIMRELKSMGHRITLIRPKQSDEVEQHTLTTGLNTAAVTTDLQVPSLPIPYYPHLRMGLPCYRFLTKQLRKLRPDIVHIVTEGPLGLAALIAGKQQSIKVSSGYHTAFHDFSRYFGWKVVSLPLLAYMKRFHNQCNATCIPSQTTQHQLAEFGFKHLYQVGRGVDTARYAPSKRSQALRQSWGVGEGTTVLMCVSRVSPEKGMDTVIKSFKALQLQQLHRHVKLVIVGDGPYKEALVKRHANDTSIIFAGFKTGEALASYYASADAFVFASQVETFGNVVTEAMASGLPIFAYHDAAAALLVDDSCGKTVPLGQEQRFIEMISELPKQQQLDQMRLAARHKVAAFSWQKPAQEMLTMFYEVLSIQTNTVTASTVTPAILPSQSIAQHPLADLTIALTPESVHPTVVAKNHPRYSHSPQNSHSTQNSPSAPRPAESAAFFSKT